ncbi:hypothetical protein CEXT_508511 [Caerostris extrusa]|uniref:Uncharacterized protein n=1 Tax=Caerostris extrusa TaxID=172846 RepID=A0AAV4V0J4_CAEEX|nr:hypothetical protein CEXT_508511 [Caerostris extrusa]
MFPLYVLAFCPDGLEYFEDSLEKHLTFPHHRSYAVLIYQRFIPVYPGQNDGRREPDGHLSQPRSLTSSHPRQINSRLLDKSSRGVQNLPSATLSRQRHRKSNGLHLTGCILITIPPGHGSFQWKITAFKWNRLPKLDLFQPPPPPLITFFHPSPSHLPILHLMVSVSTLFRALKNVKTLLILPWGIF